MPGEIHEDVDVVLPDLHSHILVPETNDVAPCVGQALQVLRNLIGLCDVRIAQDLE